jgi:nucleotide-binding universal stress UspA family protein
MEKRRIVVGVDGSLSSREALRWAAHLVRVTGGKIVVVHASGLRGRQPHGPSPSRLAAADVLELEWCRELVQAQIPFSTVVRPGHPLRVVPAAADQHDADLILVGNRGVGSATTLGLGRTSLRLLRHSRRPVLVAPEPGVGSHHLPLRRILVAVDDSPAADQAIHVVAGFATAFGSAITILRALDAGGAGGAGPRGRGEPDDTAPMPRVGDHLPAMARLLSDQGVAVQTLIRRGDPVDVVRAAATSLDPDLVAVGARGCRHPRSSHLGHVSRSVVRSTHRPSLVVPAPTVGALRIPAPLGAPVALSAG